MVKQLIPAGIGTYPKGEREEHFLLRSFREGVE
jgi:hypothetical protein